MKASFEIDGKRYVKRMAPGEHVPGMIQVEPDSAKVTWPCEEDPLTAARLDEIEAKPPVKSEPKPRSDYAALRQHQAFLEEKNRALEAQLKAVKPEYPEVNMKWLCEGPYGYVVMDLGPGRGTNLKRICPLPLDFTQDDVKFIEVSGGAVNIDYDARKASQKDQKWNALSPLERLANAVRPKRT